MNIVLLQDALAEHEVQQLIREFPGYLFLVLSHFTYKKLGEADWARVEILFGDRLTCEELEKAPRLRWIHTPSPNLNRFCLKDIEKKGTILITTTKGEDIFQIGEFVTTGILAFAKNLFHWHDTDQTPVILWDSKWRDTMWTLKNRILIQIGLGGIGIEIARRAKQMEMMVWGVTKKPTFYPHCDKIFSLKKLHDILPSADVVSICLPRGEEKELWFDPKDLERMKKGSILVIIGSRSIIDEELLVRVAEKDHLRGILIDAFYQLPIPANSKLWTIPNIIITPEVAPRPKSEEREAFKNFRYNLRQYIHGNFNDMRNQVS